MLEPEDLDTLRILANAANWRYYAEHAPLCRCGRQPGRWCGRCGETVCGNCHQHQPIALKEGA